MNESAWQAASQSEWRNGSQIANVENGHLSTVRGVKRNRSPPLRCLCRVLLVGVVGDYTGCGG